MKRIVFLIISGLLLRSFISFAQPRYSPDVRAKKETRWMQDSLGLKAVQAGQVNHIILSFNKDMDKAVLLTDSTGRLKRQQYLKNKKDSQMKAVLDKGQYKKYLRIEKQFAPPRQHVGVHKPR